MPMNFTPLIRPYFRMLAGHSEKWSGRDSIAATQSRVLQSLLKRGRNSEFGRRNAFGEILGAADLYAAFSAAVGLREYEDIRSDVMRMVNGERDVLWPGRCMNFAQSSGTSGGRSKYIPVTPDSLYRCHYAGSADCVAYYLANHNPESRIFAGKALILGGSFASELRPADPKVRVGDLSATLIDNITPWASLFRVPGKKIALMPDWQEKLPLLVESSLKADVTNISGVPSWFLTVLRRVMAGRGVDSIHDVWPNLEVFFHGGISFEPYRETYESFTDSRKMHFVETYNASEGFFAVQDRPDIREMLLILDNDVFYEFEDVDDPEARPVPAWEVEEGKVYEMIITSSNGLWRYRLGDTVRVTSAEPLRIRIAGRTKSFINAFGEELMEENAAQAITEACAGTGASIANYTAAPVFAEGNRRGRHQWLIEWIVPPQGGVEKFAAILDDALRKVNSDYDAKRAHTIFLDAPEIISLPAGTFDRWLRETGNHRLGGQRKVPRLSNDRKIADSILSLKYLSEIS